MTPAQWFYRVVQARRTLPHGQRPTDAHVQVARHLSRWQHAEPSHGQLASAARVHRNTVGAALKRLRALGLINWQRQAVRLAGGHVAQIANRYFLQEQASLPMPAPMPPKGKKDSIFPRSTNTVHRSELAAMLNHAGRLPDLLAARRAAWEAQAAVG